MAKTATKTVSTSMRPTKRISVDVGTIELEKKFSGEESYGRYLDFNTLHGEYINLKGVKKMDYLQYLNEFDDFAKMYPKAIKTSPEYKA